MMENYWRSIIIVSMFLQWFALSQKKRAIALTSIMITLCAISMTEYPQNASFFTIPVAMATWIILGHCKSAKQLVKNSVSSIPHKLDHLVDKVTSPQPSKIIATNRNCLITNENLLLWCILIDKPPEDTTPIRNYRIALSSVISYNTPFRGDQQTSKTKQAKCGDFYTSYFYFFFHYILFFICF